MGVDGRWVREDETDWYSMDLRYTKSNSYLISNRDVFPNVTNLQHTVGCPFKYYHRPFNK